MDYMLKSSWFSFLAFLQEPKDIKRIYWTTSPSKKMWRKHKPCISLLLYSIVVPKGFWLLHSINVISIGDISGFKSDISIHLLLLLNFKIKGWDSWKHLDMSFNFFMKCWFIFWKNILSDIINLLGAMILYMVVGYSSLGFGYGQNKLWILL